MYSIVMYSIVMYSIVMYSTGTPVIVAFDGTTKVTLHIITDYRLSPILVIIVTETSIVQLLLFDSINNVIINDIDDMSDM